MQKFHHIYCIVSVSHKENQVAQINNTAAIHQSVREVKNLSTLCLASELDPPQAIVWRMLRIDLDPCTYKITLTQKQKSIVCVLCCRFSNSAFKKPKQNLSFKTKSLSSSVTMCILCWRCQTIILII